MNSGYVSVDSFFIITNYRKFEKKEIIRFDKKAMDIRINLYLN
jgi:hypothetical protein